MAPSLAAARFAGLHLLQTNVPVPPTQARGLLGDCSRWRRGRNRRRHGLPNPSCGVRRSGRPPAARRPRPRRTHSGSRAGCAVGRGLGTRLRAAARPRAAPAAPHRPPPAEGPPSPPSSPELLRRGWRSLHFRLARGVPGKCPRRPPHNLFSGFLSGARSQPVHPSGHAQDSVLRPRATVARRYISAFLVS